MTGPRRITVDPARILYHDHDARRAHRKLALDMCTIILLIIAAGIITGNWTVAPFAQAPLAWQAVLAHHYRF